MVETAHSHRAQGTNGKAWVIWGRAFLQLRPLDPMLGTDGLEREG